MEYRTTPTTCPFCGVGCGILLQVLDDRIIGVLPDFHNPINQGKLCIKGWTADKFIHHPDRLTKPLIRKDGRLVESSWDEAYDFIVSNLNRIHEKHGSGALGALASAKCTNEENYLLQKWFRARYRTNNIDHCARLCHAPTVAGLAASFGSGAMTNSINEFTNTDCFFIIGSNTTETHPIIAGKIFEAKNKGAKVIAADPRKIHISRFADVHMQQRLGTDIALVNGMVNHIIERRIYDKSYVDERTEGFSELAECVKEYSLEKVEKITGVPKELIARAAELYATSDKSAIVYAMGITQHHVGTDNVKSLANLAMLCGKVGKEASGVNPLRGQNNVQGACDVGGLPNVFCGYQRVDDSEVLKKFKFVWQTVGLNDKAGLTLPKMLEAALSGGLKALFVLAENSMLTDPDIAHVEEALKKLELLAVVDIFMTETAELAHVVLPGTTFAERDGTYTNTERRVQKIRRAVDSPGEAKQEWLIIKELMERSGMPPQPNSPEEIFEEIRKVTPQYAGMTYERLDEFGLQWPCPSENHRGTVYLHKDKFSRGLGKFFAVHHKEPFEAVDEEYPLWLTTGRTYFHFHTTSMTRKAPLLVWESPSAYVEVSKADAEKLGLKSGDKVKITSRRGSIEAKAFVTNKVKSGVIFIPFHFAEAAANRLTINALDPVSNIPEFKVCAVRMEKVV